MESVRQDRTSFKKGGRRTTPNLYRIANQSHASAFLNCFSHGIWTLSSSASILTGRAPSNHRTWSPQDKLPDQIRTVPEAFRSQGYKTVCISPNAHLSSATGLNRGFENFHYLNKKSLVPEVGVKKLARYFRNISEHSGGLTRDTTEYCLGYFTNMMAKEYIDKASSSNESLFLYLHYGDSHHPYLPPKKWEGTFENDFATTVKEARSVAKKMHSNLYKYIAYNLPFKESEWNDLQVLYDTVISYVDSLIGSLVDYIHATLDNPIVVITSDHGEIFGEKGLLSHVLLTERAVSNVPLVISGLDLTEVSKKGLIQHADVMNLLISECDIDANIPLGINVRNQTRRYAVTQRSGARARKILDHINGFNTDFDRGRFPPTDVTHLRTKKYSLVVSSDCSQLYYHGDSRENYDSDLKPSFKRVYNRWKQKYGLPISQKTSRSTMGRTMKQQLKDLGYLVE